MKEKYKYLSRIKKLNRFKCTQLHHVASAFVIRFRLSRASYYYFVNVKKSKALAKVYLELELLSCLFWNVCVI